MAKPGRQIRRRQRDELLVGIQPAAVRRGELATNGRRFHAPRRKHAKASGNKLFRSDQWMAGRPSPGSPCGTSPSSLTPARRGPAGMTPRCPPRPATRDRLVPEKHLAQHEHDQRGDADAERRGLGLVQMLEDVGTVLPEIALDPREATEVGQLRADEKQREAALEADHDAFGNEAHDGPRFDQPSHERDPRDHQGRAGRQRQDGGVTVRQSAQRRSDRSEMADVRPIAVCFELQKSQNASPENKQEYRPA